MSSNFTVDKSWSDEAVFQDWKASSGSALEWGVDAFNSIQSAIAKAESISSESNPVAIHIAAGEYKEALAFNGNGNITLQGAADHGTILTGWIFGCDKVNAMTNVTISGLSIVGATQAQISAGEIAIARIAGNDIPYRGIIWSQYQGSNLQILDNKITASAETTANGNGVSGVRIEGISGVVVRGNEIHVAGTIASGIVICGGSNPASPILVTDVTISDNIITAGYDGINLSNNQVAGNITIRGNTVNSAGSCGIAYSADQGTAVISGNTIYNSTSDNADKGGITIKSAQTGTLELTGNKIGEDCVQDIVYRVSGDNITASGNELVDSVGTVIGEAQIIAPPVGYVLVDVAATGSFVRDHVLYTLGSNAFNTIQNAATAVAGKELEIIVSGALTSDALSGANLSLSLKSSDVTLAQDKTLEFSGNSNFNFDAQSTLTGNTAHSGYGYGWDAVRSLGNLTIDHFDGDINVYGQNARAILVKGGDLVINNGLNGNVSAVMGTSNDKQNGTIAAWTSNNAGGAVTINGGISGSVSIIGGTTGGRQIGAILAYQDLTVNGDISGYVGAQFQGGNNAWGLVSWYQNIVINGDITSTAVVEGVISGASHNGLGIYAMAGSVIMDGTIAGTVYGKGGTSGGYGIYAKEDVQVVSISGKVQGDAYNELMANTQSEAAAVYAGGDVFGGWNADGTRKALDISVGAELLSTVGRSNAAGIQAGGSVFLTNAGSIFATSEYLLDSAQEHKMPQTHSNGDYLDDSWGGLSFGILANGAMNITNTGIISGVKHSKYGTDYTLGYAIYSGSAPTWDATLERYIVNPNNGMVNDVIVNGGVIRGNVALNGGDDSFTLTVGGAMEGFVDMGAGKDAVSVTADWTNADLIFGAGGSDVLNVADGVKFSGKLTLGGDILTISGDGDFTGLVLDGSGTFFVLNNTLNAADWIAKYGIQVGADVTVKTLTETSIVAVVDGNEKNVVAAGDASAIPISGDAADQNLNIDTLAGAGSSTVLGDVSTTGTGNVNLNTNIGSGSGSTSFNTVQSEANVVLNNQSGTVSGTSIGGANLEINNAGTLNGGVIDNTEQGLQVLGSDVVISNDGHLNANITATGKVTITRNTNVNTLKGAIDGTEIEVTSNTGTVNAAFGSSTTNTITLVNNTDAEQAGLVDLSSFTTADAGTVTLTNDAGAVIRDSSITSGTVNLTGSGTYSNLVMDADVLNVTDSVVHLYGGTLGTANDLGDSTLNFGSADAAFNGSVAAGVINFSNVNADLGASASIGADAAGYAFKVNHLDLDNDGTVNGNIFAKTIRIQGAGSITGNIVSDGTTQYDFSPEAPSLVFVGAYDGKVQTVTGNISSTGAIVFDGGAVNLTGTVSAASITVNVADLATYTTYSFAEVDASAAAALMALNLTIVDKSLSAVYGGTDTGVLIGNKYYSLAYQNGKVSLGFVDVVVTTSQIFVDASWSGKAVNEIVTVNGQNYVIGVNAFSDLRLALTEAAKSTENVTVTVNSDCNLDLSNDLMLAPKADITIVSGVEDGVQISGVQPGGKTPDQGQMGIYIDNNGTYTTFTIGNDVSLNGVYQFMPGYPTPGWGTTEHQTVILSGELTAAQFWTYYSDLVITETGKLIGAYGDGMWKMRGNGTIVVTGAVVDTSADLSSLATSIQGGYISVDQVGIRSITATDAYLNVAQFSISSNTAGSFTLDLTNSILKVDSVATIANSSAAVQWNLKENSRLILATNLTLSDPELEIILSGSSFEVKNVLTNAATIRMDYTSTLSFGSIVNTGTVSVDMTGFTDGVYRLIVNKTAYTEADYKALLGEANWNESYTVIENTLFAANVNTSIIYADSAWSTGYQLGDSIALPDGTTAYYKFNAFADLAGAFTAVDASGTVHVGSGSYGYDSDATWSAMTVNNAGTWNTTKTLKFSDGTVINNQSGAVIDGLGNLMSADSNLTLNNYGVVSGVNSAYVSYQGGTVNNYGEIKTTGTTNGQHSALLIGQGGTVNNAVGASIYGYREGIEVFYNGDNTNTGSAVINNYGSITGTGKGIFAWSPDAVDSGAIQINNYEGGIISGANGIYLNRGYYAGNTQKYGSNAKIELVNEGTISGTTNYGYYSALSYFGSNVLNAVSTFDNRANATLTGVKSGMELWNDNIEVSNAGEISGGEYGIHALAATTMGMAFRGYGLVTVTANSGTIYGGTNAIYAADLIQITSNSGVIGKKGDLVSVRGLNVYGGYISVVNQASGVIAGSEYAIYADSAVSTMISGFAKGAVILENDGLVDGNIYGNAVTISGSGSIQGTVTAKNGAAGNSMIAFAGDYSGTAVQTVTGDLVSESGLIFDGGTVKLSGTISAASVTVNAADLSTFLSYTFANLTDAAAEALIASTITVYDKATANSFTLTNGVGSYGGENYIIYADQGDITLVKGNYNLDVMLVDETFTESNVPEGYRLGLNAFTNLESRVQKAKELRIAGGTYSGDVMFTSTDNVVVSNQGTVSGSFGFTGGFQFTNNGSITVAVPYSDCAVATADDSGEQINDVIVTLVNNGSIAGISGSTSITQGVTANVTNNAGADMDEVVASWVTLDNQGTMYAEGNLVSFYGTSSITNTGTMTGTSAALYSAYGDIDSTTITNSGTIHGDTWAFFRIGNPLCETEEKALVINNLAGGEISGGGAFSLSNGGYVRVNNAGNIIGTGTGSNGVGYAFWGQNLYPIVESNTGTIFGSYISIMGVDVRIANNAGGVIGKYGESISTGGVVASGSLNVVNDAGGEIYGSTVALQSAGTMTLTNNGVIHGGIAANAMTLNGTGTINGSVSTYDDAVNTTLTIAGGLTTFNSESFKVNTLAFTGGSMNLNLAPDAELSFDKLSITVDSSDMEFSSYTFATLNENAIAKFNGLSLTISLVDSATSTAYQLVDNSYVAINGSLYLFVKDPVTGTSDVSLSIVKMDAPNILVNSAYAQDNVPEGYIFGVNAFNTLAGGFAAGVSTGMDVVVNGGSFSESVSMTDKVSVTIKPGVTIEGLLTFSADGTELYVDAKANLSEPIRMNGGTAYLTDTALQRMRMMLLSSGAPINVSSIVTGAGAVVIQSGDNWVMDSTSSAIQNLAVENGTLLIKSDAALPKTMTVGTPTSIGNVIYEGNSMSVGDGETVSFDVLEGSTFKTLNGTPLEINLVPGANATIQIDGLTEGSSDLKINTGSGSTANVVVDPSVDTNKIINTGSGDVAIKVRVTWPDGFTGAPSEVELLKIASGETAFSLSDRNKNSGALMDTSISINLYGGGVASQPGNDDPAYLYVNNVTYNWLFGGSNAWDTPNKDSYVFVEDSSGVAVYGGGESIMFHGTVYGASMNNATTYVKNSDHNAVIGGGRGSGADVQNATLTIDGGRSRFVYGGGYGANTATANLEIKGGADVDLAYGGGAGGNAGTVNFTISGEKTVVSKVYGGGSGNVTVNNINLILNNKATVDSVYGGGDFETHMVHGNIDILVDNADVTTALYGVGRSNMGTDSLVTVTLQNGADVNELYGGAYSTTGAADSFFDINDIIVNVSDSTVGSLYGAGRATLTDLSDADDIANVKSVVVSLNAGSVVTDSVYGGAFLNSSDTVALKGGFVIESTEVNIGDGAQIGQGVVGGSFVTNGSVLTETSVVNFNGGSTLKIYGGDFISTSRGENAFAQIDHVFVNMNATSDAVVHGGSIATQGSANVVNSTITVASGVVLGDVYAGGYGNNSSVTNGTVVLKDGSSVNNLVVSARGVSIPGAGVDSFKLVFDGGMSGTSMNLNLAGHQNGTLSFSNMTGAADWSNKTVTGGTFSKVEVSGSSSVTLGADNLGTLTDLFFTVNASTVAGSSAAMLNFAAGVSAASVGAVTITLDNAGNGDYLLLGNVDGMSASYTINGVTAVLGGDFVIVGNSMVKLVQTASDALSMTVQNLVYSTDTLLVDSTLGSEAVVRDGNAYKIGENAYTALSAAEAAVGTGKTIRLDSAETAGLASSKVFTLENNAALSGTLAADGVTLDGTGTYEMAVERTSGAFLANGTDFTLTALNGTDTVYAGGMSALASSDLTLNGATVTDVYAGGDSVSGTVASAVVTMTSGNITNIREGNADSSVIYLNGGTVGNVIGNGASSNAVVHYNNVSAMTIDGVKEVNASVTLTQNAQIKNTATVNLASGVYGSLENIGVINLEGFTIGSLSLLKNVGHLNVKNDCSISATLDNVGTIQVADGKRLAFSYSGKEFILNTDLVRGTNSFVDATATNFYANGRTLDLDSFGGTAIYASGKSGTTVSNADLTISNAGYETAGTVVGVASGAAVSGTVSVEVKASKITTSKCYAVLGVEGNGTVGTVRTDVNPDVILAVTQSAGKLTSGLYLGIGNDNKIYGSTKVALTGDAQMALNIEGNHGWSESLVGGFWGTTAGNEIFGNTAVEITGNSSVVRKGTTYGNEWGGNILGGGSGTIHGDSSVRIDTTGEINLKGGSIIGGSSWDGTVVNSSVTVNNGTITIQQTEGAADVPPKRAIYGGSYGNSVTAGNATVSINGGTVNANIYAGSRTTNVGGNATVNLNGGSITGMIAGNKDRVTGTSTLNLGGSTFGAGSSVTGFDQVNVNGNGLDFSTVDMSDITNLGFDSGVSSAAFGNVGFDDVGTTLNFNAGTFSAERIAMGSGNDTVKVQSATVLNTVSGMDLGGGTNSFEVIGRNGGTFAFDGNSITNVDQLMVNAQGRGREGRTIGDAVISMANTSYDTMELSITVCLEQIALYSNLNSVDYTFTLVSGTIPAALSDLSVSVKWGETDQEHVMTVDGGGVKLSSFSNTKDWYLWSADANNDGTNDTLMLSNYANSSRMSLMSSSLESLGNDENRMKNAALVG